MLISILKITGIVLLCLVAFAVAAVLFCLLMPVKYKGAISFRERTYACFDLSWLFSLITFSLHYDDDVQKELKVMGKVRRIPTDSQKPDKSTEDYESNKAIKEEKKQKLSGKIKKAYSTFQKSDNRKSLVKATECLTDIIKKIIPKKISGELSFGFEDPADTGKALMLLGVLYPLYGETIQINPFFEKRNPEGTLDFSGRFTLAAVLFPALKVVLDKNIRSIYNEIRE